MKNDAKVIAIPDGHVEPPYDTLLSDDAAGDNNLENDNIEDNKRLVGTVNWQEARLGLKLPTDDSPFYFAKEPVPKQMVILLETVTSAILSIDRPINLLFKIKQNLIEWSGFI